LEYLRSRFVYSGGKVTVRGLGMLTADQQLNNLIEWLGKMQGALPEAVSTQSIAPLTQV
jgi:transcription-repair coupling factor (superfamily II helicase)